MMLSVIIVTTGQGASFPFCRDAVSAWSDATEREIIVVDNASTAPPPVAGMPDVIPVRLNRRVGYGAAVNAGLRRSSGDLIAVLHDDVVVAPQWTTECCRLFQEQPDIGAAGPVTNWARSPQCDPDAEYAEATEFAVYAAERQSRFQGQWREVEYVDGCCLVVRREALIDTGGMDVRFTPGYGETLDFCYRARQQGWRIAVALGMYAHHFGGAVLAGEMSTAGSEPARRSLGRLRDKWLRDVPGMEELPAPPLFTDRIRWGSRYLLQVNPSLPQLRQTGEDAARSNDAAGAVRAFRRALWMEAGDTDTLLNLAAVYLQTGRYDAAWPLLQDAAAQRPDRAEVWYTMGVYHRLTGRPADALAALRTAIEKNVHLDKAYDEYARVAGELGLTLDQPPADFVFYASGIRFDGSTIHTRSLGGSESALYYMARILAARGFRVRVFNRCEQPGIYDGVEYAELVDYHLFKRFNKCRVFISSRSFLPLYDPPDAGQLCLWLHDTPTVWQFQEERPAEIDWRRVLILTLSEWHTREWMQALSLGPENFFITRNGFDPETFTNLPQQRDRYKLMYTSRPVRGLEQLLDIWPAIRASVPQAHVHAYTYALSSHDHEIEPFLKKAQQPGVHLHDPVSKRVLAEELATARLLVYPSIFQETSCISAIEAQAAGVPVVTSALAALTETVVHGSTGILLEGDARSPEYQQAYAEAVVSLLQDDDAWQRFSDQARRHVFDSYTWESIAGDWMERFRPFLNAGDASGHPSSPTRGTRLSVCMIVKNEETTLPVALNSVRAIADEIVVVDTGSTDRTVQIAREAGARVLHHVWTNDFAAARNVSLEAATGDWVLYIDADERVPESEYEKIRRMLERGDIMAVNVLLHTPEEPGQILQTTTIDYCRLFRRDPRIRFEGRLHEQILPSINAAGGAVCRSDIVLEHWGYHRDPQKDTSRAARNMQMLSEILQQHPADLFSRFYYAKSLRLLGRYDDAQQELQRVLDAGGGDLKPRLIAECHTILGQIHLAADRHDRAREHAVAARALDPDAPLPRYLIAASAMDQGDFPGALSELTALNALAGQESFMRRQGLLNRGRLLLDIGNCHYRMNDLVQAERWYRQSTAADPGNVETQFNLGVVLLKRGNLQDAQAALQRALELNPGLEPAAVNLQICQDLMEQSQQL